MKAIVFAKAGNPHDVLELLDVTEPMPKPDEVVIEVVARPIHPSDVYFIRGTYRIRPALPQIAGLSGVGTVVHGDLAAGLPRGTRVAFRWPGAWAERVAVPVERTFRLAEDISDDDDAQLPLNPITAWGLLDVAGVRPGDWIGVTAPTSSVAQLVMAIAAMRHIRTVPIESNGDVDLAEKVRTLTSGEGLTALLDCVGGSLVERLFAAMRPGGVIVAYGTLSNEAITLRNGTLIYSNLSWHGFGIDGWLAGITAEAKARMLDTLQGVMREHRLPLPVRARFPIASFKDALRSAEERAPGKVILE